MTAARRFFRFNAVSAGGFAVQLLTVAMLSRHAGLAAPLATAAGVAAALIHNFAWHRAWTWADRPMTRARTARAFARFVAATGLVSLTGNVTVVALLVSAAGVDVLAANVAAVALCGLVNYRIGDRVVFGRAS
jgi:putative flippase GtrA